MRNTLKLLHSLILIFGFSLSIVGQINIENTPTTQTLWSSTIAPNGDAFIVGNSGTVIKKTAGCSQWENVITPTTSGLRDIAFLQDSIGIIVGVGGTIIRSTDGGNNWTSVSSGVSSGLLAVTALNDSILVAGGGGSSGNLFIRSSDFGQTWDTATTTLPWSPFDIAVVNKNTLISSGVMGNVYISNDRGLTWVNLSGSFSGTLSSIDFADENVGVIAGQGGAIYRTTDGGSTWSTGTSNTTAFLNKVKAVSASEFYAVGITGTMIESSDSGKTWSAVSTGLTAALRVIDVSDNEVFAGGNNGIVFNLNPGSSVNVLFSEDFCAFDDSTTVPTFWTNSNTPNPNSLWRFDNPNNASNNLNAVFNPPFAIFDADFYGNANADSAVLITAGFNTTGTNEVSLLWHEAFDPGQGNMTTRIEGWDGSSWIKIYENNGSRDANGFVNVQTGPNALITAKRSANLTGLGNKTNVMLRFTMIASGNQRTWWAIDDIEVIDHQKEIEIQSIQIDGSCALPLQDNPKVRVKNNSDFSVFPIELAYQIGNGPVQYNFYSMDLPAGQDTLLEVSNTGVSVSSSNEIKVWLRNSYDAIALNDTVTAFYGNSNLALHFDGDTLNLCPGDSLQINAGVTADTYQWSGVAQSATNQITVSSDGWVILEVTSGNCSARDSLYVQTVAFPANPMSNFPTTLTDADTLTLPFAPANEVRYMVYDQNGLVLDTILSADYNYVFGTPGTYDILLTLMIDGCEQTYTQTVEVTDSKIGIAESALEFEVRLFPNPASDVVRLAANEGKYTVEIQAATGVTVFRKSANLNQNQPTEIRVAHLASGVYFIHLFNESGKGNTIKLIKH